MKYEVKHRTVGGLETSYDEWVVSLVGDSGKELTRVGSFMHKTCAEGLAAQLQEAFDNGYCYGRGESTDERMRAAVLHANATEDPLALEALRRHVEAEQAREAEQGFRAQDGWGNMTVATTLDDRPKPPSSDPELVPFDAYVNPEEEGTHVHHDNVVLSSHPSHVDLENGTRVHLLADDDEARRQEQAQRGYRHRRDVATSLLSAGFQPYGVDGPIEQPFDPEADAVETMQALREKVKEEEAEGKDVRHNRYHPWLRWIRKDDDS